MHEMSLVRDIVDVVLDACRGGDVARVSKVRLSIGELHDVVVEYVPPLFRYLARDTIAADAEVLINVVPARLVCSACGAVFRVDHRDPRGWACPDCHARDGFSLRSGMEFMIESIEVEDAEDETAGTSPCVPPSAAARTASGMTSSAEDPMLSEALAACAS